MRQCSCFFIRHFLLQQVYSLNKDHTKHIKSLIRGRFGLMSFPKGLVMSRDAEFAKRMEIFACLTEGTSFKFKWDLITNVYASLLGTSLFCAHTHIRIHRNILQNPDAFSCLSCTITFFFRVVSRYWALKLEAEKHGYLILYNCVRKEHNVIWKIITYDSCIIK